MPELKVGSQISRFHGGLKLRHHKKVACEVPVARPPLPERLYVPLRQHQGPAGEPLVNPGDRVLAGQPLTAAGDDRQVPVHAPVSGRVVDLVDWPVSWPPNSLAPCLVIEPDGDERADPAVLTDWAAAEPGRIIDHLRASGLSGLGGAMFPTAAKLRGGGREDWNIHTLILNGSECEPWISCDEMLMRERPEAILQGACILARAIGAEDVVIGIEDQMGAVRECFEKAAPKADPDGVCRVVQVTTIYPEGGEKQLIQVLTGREVPHDGLPQDLGVVCLNVATAAAARDAVIEGLPVTERIVTVSGPGIARPRNLLALIGTPAAHLVEAAGGYQGEVSRLILGGPMSGLPLASDRVPVTKGSNCFLALRAEDVARSQPVMPCINCGECVRVCPARLLPQELYRYIRAGDLDEARSLNLFDCIECGCCAQVCPSHLPLVDYYRHGKGALIERGIEAERARRARERFEAREQRLSEEKAARRARREEREKRLARPDAARDEVAAAVERANKGKGDK